MVKSGGNFPPGTRTSVCKVSTWVNDLHKSLFKTTKIKYIYNFVTVFFHLCAGALAAYNMGASTVESYESVDANPTGRNYSNDVVARSQFFKDNGY